MYRSALTLFDRLFQLTFQHYYHLFALSFRLSVSRNNDLVDLKISKILELHRLCDLFNQQHHS